MAFGHGRFLQDEREARAFRLVAEHDVRQTRAVAAELRMIGSAIDDVILRRVIAVCEVSCPRRMDRVVCLSLGRTGRCFIAIAVAHGDEDEEHADDCGHARVEEEPS